MASPADTSALITQVEFEATSLTVEKLKNVLRNSGLPVSGTKGVLIARIKDELRRLSQSKNTQQLEFLCVLIQNSDKPSSSTHATSTTAYNSPFASSARVGSHNTGRGASSSVPSQPLTGPGSGPMSGMSFVGSPFQALMEPVSSRMDLDSREHTRDTKEFTFKIRGDILDRTRQDKKLKILLYCATDEALRSPAHIAFPTSFEVRLNGEEVRGSFRGLKNKPGTTRPTDVTALVQQSSLQDNRVSVTWALTSRRYCMMFQLVRYYSAEDLVRKLREAKSISKASVLKEMNSWADDNDIVATSSRMSLKCPLSTLRIQTPCRSKRCKHNQCFDALSFLQLQEQAPQWTCPVCNQQVPFEILQVDEYVEDILKNSPQSAEQVTVAPSGHWSLVSDNGTTDQNPNSASIKRESSEFSDDIIEIIEPTTTSAVRTPPTSFSPLLNGSARATPSSGPHKRLASTAVIDLTGDSDDDDDNDDDPPARPPAKRQQLSSTNGSSWGQGLAQISQSQPHGSNRFAFSLPKQRSSLQNESAFQR